MAEVIGIPAAENQVDDASNPGSQPAFVRVNSLHQNASATTRITLHAIMPQPVPPDPGIRSRSTRRLKGEQAVRRI